jgi:acetyl esterase/lipase
VLYNMPLAIEDHVDLIGDTLTYMAEHGHTVAEPSEQAQAQWVAETNAIAEMTLLPTSASSWYMGANIPGKPRRALVYLGGAPRYRSICDNVQKNDYRGFVFATSSRGIDTARGSIALDPSVMFIVEALEQQQFTGFREAGIEGARGVVESFVEMQAPKQDVASVTEHAYGDHPEQRLRIYVPQGDGPHPVLVSLHGGGFVAGSLAVADEPARDLANRTGAIVVSATYRRAPEHKFPAAHDDAYAALRWTVDHIAEHGGDALRVGLAGDSAGANLAVGAALQAVRDDIDLSALVLIDPLVNATIETASRAEFATGYVIEIDDLAWFGEQYVSAPEDVTDVRLALDTADLSGLPPTLITTSECDTLRDEGELLVQKLREAGVDAHGQRFDGLSHDSFLMSLAVARAEGPRRAAADFLVSHLSRERVGALV